MLTANCQCPKITFEFVCRGENLEEKSSIMSGKKLSSSRAEMSENEVSLENNTFTSHTENNSGVRNVENSDDYLFYIMS